MRPIHLGLILMFVFVVLANLASAATVSEAGGWVESLDDYVGVVTALLALILGCLSYIAYKRDGRAKFLFIVAAFFIFALKGLLVATSDFLSFQRPTAELIGDIMDAVSLVCFFLGIIKK